MSYLLVDDHARASASFQYLDANDWNGYGASWSNPTQQLGADPDWFQETYADTADADSVKIQLHSFESGFDVDNQDFKDFLQDLDAAAPPPPAMDDSFDIESLDFEVLDQLFKDIFADDPAVAVAAADEVPIADVDTPQWVPVSLRRIPAPEERQTFNYHLPLQSTHSNHSSVFVPRHNKYKRWTQTEHRLFLLGLERHGQGKWKQISTNFIPSRTPAQIASHAQKYFLHKNVSGARKRSSIHDRTQVMDQVSQFNLSYNQMGYFNNGPYYYI